MSETVAPFSPDHGPDLPETLAGAGGVSVQMMEPRRRYSLRVKGSHIADFESANALTLPRKIGAIWKLEETTIFCLGPDEWLISIPDNADSDMSLEGTSASFSLVDISHRNVGFTLNGPRATALINAGCPLDLSLEVFPAGKVTRTVFERAEIMIHRKSETAFEIECWRSFAPYVLGIMAKAAY